MAGFFRQLGQVFRSLRRSPGYAAAAALTLAIGLAGALAALAPAWDVLGHPFHFRDPGRVVCLSGEGPEGAAFLRPVGAPDFGDLQKEVRTLEGLAACRDSTLDLETPEGSRQVRTALVSAGFFGVLGLPLGHGRDFTSEESAPGGAPVLILTDRFWRRAFGGDPGAVGRSLNLDGVPHRIVGVLAPQRRLPFFMGDAVAFQPLVFRSGERGRARPSCFVFGRLAKGASLAALQLELDRLAPSLGPPRPAGDRSWGIKARGLLAYWRAREAPALAMTILSGVLILLLACANTAHLMLARNLDRTREWGLRSAFGAGTFGMGRPILAEAAVLCGFGGLLAVGFLAGLGRLDLLPGEALGGPVPGLMAGALGASVLLTAFLPIRWASRLDLNEALREGGTASASRGSTFLRGWLAVIQFALAFALLVGAGMSLRALERLRNIDPGYHLADLSVAIVTLRGGGDVQARGLAFQRQVLQSLKETPGIQSAAMSNTRPLVDQGHNGNVWPEGGQGYLEAGQHAVSPEYFQTLGIPLLAGRNPEEREAGACLVSLQFARRCWGEAAALGRTLHLGAANGPALEVVGVVGEARMSRLAREPIPAVYTPLALRDSGYLTIYVRSSAPAAALQGIVKQVVRQADGNARFREFQNLAARAAQEGEEPRQIRGQTLAAGLLAALLAGVGLAGTLSQAAARQKREWGIRLALGATPVQLFGRVFRRVAWLLGSGLVLGGALTWGLSRVLRHQYLGVEAADPAILAPAVLALGLTGLVAGLTPALRAARTQPAAALRSE
ncbi:ABC transporter permease [Geothrix sp. 21YS21S-2]|uniref:ABC transporter permease n=1 Tax=Geothrix sp. 21YS21S-2 TaxID=3068893 RepID=UPI0027B927ED|nr:ABC transporter permease [Geothrix sp. 21YS21S-2]